MLPYRPSVPPKTYGFDHNNLEKSYWAIFRRQSITAEVNLDVMRKLLWVQSPLEDFEKISWSSQDGACSYQSAKVFDFLYENFDEVISLFTRFVSV